MKLLRLIADFDPQVQLTALFDASLTESKKKTFKKIRTIIRKRFVLHLWHELPQTLKMTVMRSNPCLRQVFEPPASINLSVNDCT